LLSLIHYEIWPQNHRPAAPNLGANIQKCIREKKWHN